MKFEMELHPNFLSEIVVKKLQEMYEHTKEAYFVLDPVEARAAIAVVLDYFMPPLDYAKWRDDNVLDRNLAEEVVEGFDHLERSRVESYIERLIDEKLKGKTSKREWVGLTDDEINKAIQFPYHAIPFARTIEAKLKEKNT